VGEADDAGAFAGAVVVSTGGAVGAATGAAGASLSVVADSADAAVAVGAGAGALPEGAAQRTDGATSKPAIGRRTLAVRMLILTGLLLEALVRGSQKMNQMCFQCPNQQGSCRTAHAVVCRNHDLDFTVKSLD